MLHTHSVNGIAVSAQRQGVLPISQQSTLVLSSIGYHDYEGLALNNDEKSRLVRDLGNNAFLMLRNHGLLTVGDTVAEAFGRMYFFEAVCTIQVRAQACGVDLIPVDQKFIASIEVESKKANAGSNLGQLIWPGLLRRLDRSDPSYKT